MALAVGWWLRGRTEPGLLLAGFGVVFLARLVFEPVVFPFLRDCAGVAGLRLAEEIEIRVQASQRRIADLRLRLEQIVSPNGHDVLWGF